MSLSASEVQSALDGKTKPQGSLGRLETVALQLALLQQTLQPRVEVMRMGIFAASHGISQEGVSAYPAVVTAQMVHNFLNGGAAICVLCQAQGIQLEVLDVGVDDAAAPLPPTHPQLWRRAVRAGGTRSFAVEAAMTAAELEAALAVGRSFVEKAVREGVEVIGLGEMGIGNTTAASALCAALLREPAAVLCGHGTGLDAAGLAHKVTVVERALALHGPGCVGALDWLRCVGGYEVAAMVGAVLAAHERRLAVMVDGFIVTAAVLVAHAVEPGCLAGCFFSHVSAEGGHGRVLKYLGVEPLLDWGLRLGEGTGAALALPFLKSAARILSEMATFSSAGVAEKA
jgi:nicotinate-nucleotide--dimethylbenzimidazole phosphoribosyltransferase